MTDPDVSAALGDVSRALAKGAVREAIELSESYADRGLAHPDLAYDRGVAYVMRARGPDARAGDLGRAAAGFEEAVLLRGDDVGAALALETVRAEAAKRRARTGGTVDVVEGPGLLRTASSVMPEPAWEAVAGGAALVLSVAWIVRRRAALSRSAYVAASVSAVALLLSLGALSVHRHVRATVEVGIIVAEVARPERSARRRTKAAREGGLFSSTRPTNDAHDRGRHRTLALAPTHADLSARPAEHVDAGALGDLHGARAGVAREPRDLGDDDPDLDRGAHVAVDRQRAE